MLGGILQTSFNLEKSDANKTVLYLGIEISVSGYGITFRLSEHRIEKLKYYINAHLQSNSMSSGEASSLAGKLQW